MSLSVQPNVLLIAYRIPGLRHVVGFSPRLDIHPVLSDSAVSLGLRPRLGSIACL